MLDQDTLRARALEKVLFQETWKNERTINLFRGAIWCVVGVAMAGLDYTANGRIHPTGLVHLAWGVLVLVFNFTWMKTHFHRAVPWVLATADMIVLVTGMQTGYEFIAVQEPAMADHHLDGITVSLMLILGLNMMRFSWRLSIWNGAVALAVFTWARVVNDKFDRLSYMDWILICSLTAMLVYTTMRFRSIVEGVMIDLRRIQEERVASLGALVAGVAHEMNSPLGALNANTQLVGRASDIISKAIAEPEAEPLVEAQPKLRRIVPTLQQTASSSKTAVDRIDHVVTSLRTFARLDEADVQLADLHEGLDSGLDMLPSEARAQLEVVRDFGELPKVSCRPGQLNQVWLHLFKNASEAMPEGGTLSVRTRAAPGEVEVEIEDTGCGIPKAQLEHIFDPQFNRRGDRAKLGFGLSASYGILQDHGGAIEIESEEGSGTTVRVSLPTE